MNLRDYPSTLSPQLWRPHLCRVKTQITCRDGETATPQAWIDSEEELKAFLDRCSNRQDIQVLDIEYLR